MIENNDTAARLEERTVSTNPSDPLLNYPGYKGFLCSVVLRGPIYDWFRRKRGSFSSSNPRKHLISQTHADPLTFVSFYCPKHEGDRSWSMPEKAKKPWKFGHAPSKTLN